MSSKRDLLGVSFNGAGTGDCARLVREAKWPTETIWSLYDMMRFYGHKWMGIVQGFTAVESMRIPDGKENDKISDHNRKFIQNILKGIKKDSIELGLKVPPVFIKEWISEAKRSGWTFALIKRRAPGLRDRIREEMSANLFFGLEPTKAPYYEPLKMFSDQFKVAFPSAIFDIEESGKCLSMSRNTAAVFHLMRVMETGLRSLASSLNDPAIDPSINPNWESILRKCDGELKKPLSERCDEWKQDDQFFSHATANLRAVKDAWRNPTMHVEKKYTDEEAQDVFNTVRAFMRHLATKLKEA